MATLIANATLVTADETDCLVLRDHELLFEDGVIRFVGPSGTHSSEGVAEIIEARNHVVIPGLINTHHHLYQSLTRALPEAQNAPLFEWLTALYSRWRRMDYQAVKTAAAGPGCGSRR